VEAGIESGLWLLCVKVRSVVTGAWFSPVPTLRPPPKSNVPPEVNVSVPPPVLITPELSTCPDAETPTAWKSNAATIWMDPHNKRGVARGMTARRKPAEMARSKLKRTKVGEVCNLARQDGKAEGLLLVNGGLP
jgi:hypothetical protein